MGVLMNVIAVIIHNRYIYQIIMLCPLNVHNVICQ